MAELAVPAKTRPSPDAAAPQPPANAAPAAAQPMRSPADAGRVARQTGTGGLGNAATAALLQRTPPGKGTAGAGPPGTKATSSPASPPAATVGGPGSPAGPQPAPAASPSVSKDDIERVIAEEDLTAIRRLTDADLTVTTPQQRAGLIRILADLTWTARADEAVIVRLLRSGGKAAEVTRTLDALGYRQKVLDSVDDPGLHAEAAQLLGAATAPAQGPIGQALASQQPRDVMAIGDFTAATGGQRLGLLRILLDMRWSNSAEEAKMLDILESAGPGLGSLMSDLRATGLVKALFDHIDDTKNKARLTHLLEPLNDPEIDRDLLVFNMSKFERFSVGVIGGIVSAWKEFSFSKLFMGLVRPVIHPIDTLDDYLDQLLDLIKAPSLDRLATLARDVVGFIAEWLGVLALAVAGLALLCGATVILIPGVLPLGVIAASLAADAAFFGILFLVLSGLKLLLNIRQAEEATTRRELEKQQRQIGEGVTILSIAAIMAGAARGFKAVLGKLRGSATVPEQADPAVLKDTAGEADKTSKQATAAGDELKQKAGPDQQAAAEQQAGHEQPGEAEQPPEAPAVVVQTKPAAPAESAAPAPSGEPAKPATPTTPPEQAAATASAQAGSAALKALRAQVRALRKAATTDPAAVWKLRALFESQPDSVLRKFKGDPIADAVLEKRRAANPELEKARESRRQPHQATVRVTEGGKTVGQRVRIVSGGVTPEQAAELGDWEASLATHTEAKAVRDIPLKPGQTMRITGQYDPCGPCRAAMQAAANSTGGTIVYWWPGGPPEGLTFSPQAAP